MVLCYILPLSFTPKKPHNVDVGSHPADQRAKDNKDGNSAQTLGSDDVESIRVSLEASSRQENYQKVIDDVNENSDNKKADGMRQPSLQPEITQKKSETHRDQVSR